MTRICRKWWTVKKREGEREREENEHLYIHSHTAIEREKELYSSRHTAANQSEEREKEREKKWQTSTNSEMRDEIWLLSWEVSVIKLACILWNRFPCRQSFNEYDDETLRMRMNGKNEFLISLSSRVFSRTRRPTSRRGRRLDAFYWSSSSNYQGEEEENGGGGWSAILDSSQWTKGNAKIILL